MSSSKHEWKKAEKHLYGPTGVPQFLEVSAQSFFTITGQGDPNLPPFGDKIAALYTAAFGIRMMHKSGFIPEGFFEYTVYPLEGIWDLTERGRGLAALDKSELLYTLMIRQPAFVTPALAAKALHNAAQKKAPPPLLNQVRFEQITDGPSCQILHTGPFDDEPASFAKMDAACAERGLERIDKRHREIYLSDFRRVPPARRRTILRVWVSGL